MSRLPSLTKTLRDVTAAGMTVVGVEITPTGYSLRFGLTGPAAPVADDPFARAKERLSRHSRKKARLRLGRRALGLRMALRCGRSDALRRRGSAPMQGLGYEAPGWFGERRRNLVGPPDLARPCSPAGLIQSLFFRVCHLHPAIAARRLSSATAR